MDNCNQRREGAYLAWLTKPILPIVNLKDSVTMLMDADIAAVTEHELVAVFTIRTSAHIADRVVLHGFDSFV